MCGCGSDFVFHGDGVVKEDRAGQDEMGEPGESRMDVEESGHKGVESRAPSPAEEVGILCSTLLCSL